MPSPQEVPVEKGRQERERARVKEKGRRETRAIFQEPTAGKQEEFMAIQVHSAETEGCTRTEHTQRLANPPHSIRNGFPGRWHRSFIWKDNWWGKAIEGRFSWLNRLKFQATSGLSCFHGVQANGKRVSYRLDPRALGATVWFHWEGTYCRFHFQFLHIFAFAWFFSAPGLKGPEI